MNGYYELTDPQKSIWITEQYFKNTNINNISGIFYAKKQLDFNILSKTLNIIIKENIAMRTRLIIKDGKTLQFFKEYNEEIFEKVEFKDKSSLEKFCDETNYNWHFNCFDSKLYKIYLFKLKETGEKGFFIIINHMIGDAWAVSLIANEIDRIYSNLVNNIEPVNSNKSYIKKIEKEEKYRNSDKINKDKEYWNKIYSNNIELESMETSDILINAKRLKFDIDSNLINKIKEKGYSFFLSFLSVLSIYNSKVTNKKNIFVGIPILNRGNQEEKHTMGMYVNTVPFRIDVENCSFQDFMQKMKENQYALFKHKELSYEEIYKIAKSNLPSVKYLFDITLSYQNARNNSQTSKLNYKTKWIFNKNISDSLDIHIEDFDDVGKLTILYDYQTKKYSKEDIEYLHKRLMNIFNQVMSNEKILLSDIKLITEEDKKVIMKNNQLEVKYPIDSNIIQLFKERVNKTPNSIAIKFENENLTYKELDIRSNIVANYLLKKKIKKNEIVGILLPRSMELFVCILGILKIGATYMAIDVDYPDNRIGYMIADSKTDYCISNIEQIKRIENIVNCIKIEEIKRQKNNINDVNIKIQPTDLSYIIYTSGSTGKPKGVMASHRNIINYIYSFQNEFKLTTADCILQQFSPSFDAFTEEFYPALINGIKIIAVDKKDITNVEKLENIIRDNNITIISCAPLLLNEFNKMKKLNSVKIFISGGDVLKKEYYSNLIKNAKIYNTYGPTETTVCSAYHNCKGNETTNIPIGKTIANYKNFIVNEDNNLLPKGFIGELCIGGDGLTKGYLNNEELTKSKFIKLKEINENVYKTGDLCKINKEDEIEFIGRKDTQLKIRGYRINLDEIEKSILDYPGISNSIVIDFEDKNGKKMLCCYYISQNVIIRKELMEYLEKLLPLYMIPTVYIKVDKIPTNVSGKINKIELPNPIKYLNTLKEHYIKPSNYTEEVLEEKFKKILNMEKISIDTNLFELGADSLSIIEFQTIAINENWRITTQEIFENPTIKALANIIDKEIVERNTYQKKLDQIEILKMKVNSNRKEIKNILLTGATGYLGIHILNYLLEDNNEYNIYCLIRGSNKEFSYERLKKLYETYFNKELSQYKNLITINGDMTLEKFGLSDKLYNQLVNKIDTVYNVAANVKHYGVYEVFYKTNVIGTKNVVEFALEANCNLNHISTISVSGQISSIYTKKVFDENEFFIGQNYIENVYVRSKFEAESYVLEAIKEKKLCAQIYRVGNITGRYTDGVFQKNIENNAFYSKLKTIIVGKVAPKSILNIKVDLTPVDLLSKAIVELSKKKSKNLIVYHLYNNNIISIKDIIEMLNKLKYKIKEVEDSEFKNILIESRNKIYSIDNELYNTEKKSNIDINCDKTIRELDKINFEWNKIDSSYISKVLKYMEKCNFISKEKMDEEN